MAGVSVCVLMLDATARNMQSQGEASMGKSGTLPGFEDYLKGRPVLKKELLRLL